MNRIVHFVLYIVLPIIVVMAVFWFGWGSDIFGKASALTLKEAVLLDFGVLNLKSKPHEHRFTIVNTGKNEASVAKIYSNCDCLTVFVDLRDGKLGPFGLPKSENEKPINLLVPAGAAFVLSVNLNPVLGSEGLLEKKVFLETKDGKITELPIRATLVR